ncbi:MAG: flagellin FliC [Xanthomonadaceae bacterium]|nr:flagellin FliC [Xanthomonadaceae bacterium]
MGLRVNTNTQALAAQRALMHNGDNQKASLEKLASGTRINKSADDAAGLAISEKIRASTRSLAQDMRNANDGISLIQTAEGAMNEVANILIRFRELSIQAASDTLSNVERGFIDKEVQQLKQEVDRISGSTEFNGKKLLNGETDVIDIQVGQFATENDRFRFDAQKINLTSDSLGVAGINTETKEAAHANLEQVDNAIKILSENRSEMGALQNRLQSTISNLSIYHENLTAARSRIYDVDVASETSELTKNNILTQSTISVLSQANQNPGMALKLLS